MGVQYTVDVGPGGLNIDMESPLTRRFTLPRLESGVQTDLDQIAGTHFVVRQTGGGHQQFVPYAQGDVAGSALIQTQIVET